MTEIASSSDDKVQQKYLIKESALSQNLYNNLERPKTRAPIAPHFSLPKVPAAVVLRAIRLSGPLYRDQLVQETGFSAATVNRQASALLDYGLIKERNHNENYGVVGRPRMPIELNVTGPLVLAIHIGSQDSAVSVYDAMIRMVGSINVPHHDTTPQRLLDSVSEAAGNLIERWKNRVFLRLGISLSGCVDEQGRVDFPQLEWKSVPVAEILAKNIGLRVTIASHVEAMAAAELQHLSIHEAQDTTLYFYAHETVGTALIVGGSVRTAHTRQTALGQLPYILFPKVYECPLQYLDIEQTRRFEDAISESSVVAAARAYKLPVKDFKQLTKLYLGGDTLAEKILSERATLLGAAISLLSDVVNPDRIILGGQAFTDIPQLLPRVAREVTDRICGPRKPIYLTAARQHVQQRAAGAVALDRLFHDPIAEMSSLKTR